MANVQHSALTDPNLHEPKGASTASNNEVYVADGAGSGSWTPRTHTLFAHIENISNVSTWYVPIPYNGTIAKVVCVINGTIAASDATITVSNAAGSSMGTITIAQSGSAAGDVDFLNPTSNNTVTANSFITVATDGASSNNVRGEFAIVLERS